MYFMFLYGILGGVNPYYGYWTLTCINSTFCVCLVLTTWSVIVRYETWGQCVTARPSMAHAAAPVLGCLHTPRSWTWPMWTGLAISFAVYFAGILVIDAFSETYANIPSTVPHTHTVALTHTRAIGGGTAAPHVAARVFASAQPPCSPSRACTLACRSCS
jgi:hypothetical protein